MPQWEYKTLIYGLKGRYVYSERFWVDTSQYSGKPERRYGPTERSRFIGKMWQAMRQLEEALKELDEEGWELVSSSFWTVLVLHFNGVAVMKRARSSDTGS